MKNPKIEGLVDDIKNDNISGSSILAHRSAQCLDEFATEIIQNHVEMNPKEYLTDLMELGKRLVYAQPTMAAVLNGVNTIITSIKLEYNNIQDQVGNGKKKRLKFLCTSTQANARRFIIDLKLAQETIANLYQKILVKNDQIMTISASGSVEMLLTTAHENTENITVYVPESRPMYEGRLLAQRLAQKGIKCKLIADHAMFHFLDNCTKVLVGADRVMPNGILNKIGTSGLALAAYEKQMPFYCVCECNKFVPDIIPIEKLNPPQPESQLFYLSENENRPEALYVENIYFDFTPIKHIYEFLTDCGQMDSNLLKDYIDRVEILPELIPKVD